MTRQIEEKNSNLMNKRNYFLLFHCLNLQNWLLFRNKIYSNRINNKKTKRKEKKFILHK